MHFTPRNKHNIPPNNGTATDVNHVVEPQNHHTQPHIAANTTTKDTRYIFADTNMHARERHIPRALRPRWSFTGAN